MSYTFENWKEKITTMSDREFEKFCHYYFKTKKVMWHILTNRIGLDFLEAVRHKDYTFESLTKMYREKLTRYLLDVEEGLLPPHEEDK